MKAIKKFDRAVLKAIDADINSALATVAKKYGITLTTGGGTFGDTTFTTKINGVTANDDSNSRYAKLLGLPSDIVGKTFTPRGRGLTANRTFEVVRIDLRKRKYPVIAKDISTGTVFMFEEDVVKEALK